MERSERRFFQGYSRHSRSGTVEALKCIPVENNVDLQIMSFSSNWVKSIYDRSSALDSAKELTTLSEISLVRGPASSAIDISVQTDRKTLLFEPGNVYPSSVSHDDAPAHSVC